MQGEGFFLKILANVYILRHMKPGLVSLVDTALGFHICAVTYPRIHLHGAPRNPQLAKPRTGIGAAGQKGSLGAGAEAESVAEHIYI